MEAGKPRDGGVVEKEMVAGAHGLATAGCGVGGKKKKRTSPHLCVYQSHREGGRFCWSGILFWKIDNGWRYQSIDLDMLRVQET